MARYIKAEQGLGHSVIYTRNDDKYFRYYDGKWTWRNHNPGNIHPGDVSAKHSQIGVAGGMAVFPDYQNGHDALIDCLKTERFGNRSIDQLVDCYSPPRDGNKNNPIYKKFLHDKTSVMDNKKIRFFTDIEFEELWEGIELFEGGTDNAGKIVEVYKVSRVRKDKHGFISEYYIDGQGWIAKDTALDLANRKQLDVETCTEKTGDKYLRTRSRSSIQADFDGMVEKKHEK